MAKFILLLTVVVFTFVKTTSILAVPSDWVSKYPRDLNYLEYEFEIVNSFVLPNDDDLKTPLIPYIPFTQGLVFYKQLFVSSGLYGKSYLAKYDLDKQAWVKTIEFGFDYFSEGLTFFQGNFYQLTWKKQLAMVYDANLNFIKRFNYEGAGWGLANNGKYLIRSDGSEVLYFHRVDFTLHHRMLVKHKVNGHFIALKYLNALQYAEKSLWANVWGSNWVFEIDLQGGEDRPFMISKVAKVVARVDLTPLVKDQEEVNPELSKSRDNVLNGIAYNATKKTFYFSGKRWNRIYEVRLIK